jgi:hypothetical protein
MRRDTKLFAGVFFFLLDLVTFLVGIVLLICGIVSLGILSGEGGISLVVEQVGRIIGINFSLVVLLVVLVGLALVLAATGYALKALQDAKTSEGGVKGTIRHFSPL